MEELKAKTSGVRKKIPGYAKAPELLNRFFQSISRPLKTVNNMMYSKILLVDDDPDYRLICAEALAATDPSCRSQVRG